MSADTWTRDAAGEYVRWNEPPYRNEETGELRLFLPGERPDDVDLAEHLKRIQEYYLLVFRESRKITDEQKKGRDVTDEKRRGPD